MVTREARGDRSIVIVEGLLPSTTHPLTIDLDIAMGRSLSAEIIPVVPGLDATVKSIIGDLADAQHRFLAEGTMEDRIAQVIASKRDLVERVVGQGEAWITQLSDDDLTELVQLGAG